jgi:hypothetical protein
LRENNKIIEFLIYSIQSCPLSFQKVPPAIIILYNYYMNNYYSNYYSLRKHLYKERYYRQKEQAREEELLYKDYGGIKSYYKNSLINMGFLKIIDDTQDNKNTLVVREGGDDAHTSKE